MPLMPQAPMGAPPPPDMMGGGAPMGAPPPSPYPSTNPALVAQMLGPLLQQQAADEDQLRQQQQQSVLMVLASMKNADQTSMDAASAPAPPVEDLGAPQQQSMQGNSGY